MTTQYNIAISQQIYAPENEAVSVQNTKAKGKTRQAELAHLAAVLKTVEKEVAKAKANISAAPSNAPQGSDAAAPPVNFMYALMEAVQNDQSSMSEMQITDSKSTMLAVTIESNIYASWNGRNGPLAYDNQQITKAVNNKDSNGVIQWQQQYNEDSATGQANESRQDGSVQSCQGQTSSDASNLQMKAQLIQGVNSIQTTLTNMLGNITA